MSEILSQSLWPYSERNGVDVTSDVEVLLAEPEIKLSPEDLIEARKFAVGLFEGHIENGPENQSRKSLETINKSTVTANTQTFYLDYFLTDQGKQDLQSMSIENASDTILTRTFLDVPFMTSTVDDKIRKTAASNSAAWRETQLAEYLAADASEDASREDFESVTINYQPEKLLEKLEDLQAYRRFYRQIRAELRQKEPTDLKTAKMVLLDVYAVRVNSLVAGLYADATDLARQLDISDQTDQVVSWNDRLAAAVPLLSHARAEDTFEAYTDGLARRLDLVRNGAALNEAGRITPISQELLAMQSMQAENVQAGEVKVNAEQLEVMDRTVWEGEQLKEFNEQLLAKWGLLSAYQSTWQEVGERDGPAPDGKWQYIIDKPSRKSLGVVGSKKVVFGPPVFGRSLTAESPAGALPVSAHEMTHVLQNEYDEVLAEQVPLAKIKGARYLAVREMGGIMQERKIQANLGRSRNTNLHYLRALEVKLAGGNRVQTARAFYDSYTADSELNETTAKKARELAMNRALRLFRNDGHESQPLEYAEQDLIAQALDGLSAIERSAMAIAGGSFSLRHASALHRVGLLDVPKEVTHNPADDVWDIFVKRYLPNLK